MAVEIVLYSINDANDAKISGIGSDVRLAEPRLLEWHVGGMQLGSTFWSSR
jgi:hypothetical protein